MAIEARRPGLDPREVPILPTFTPDIAANLPGPSWLIRRRAAAAEAFAGSPLPTEKDEVWRYSRIDQLDLDRFQPALPLQPGTYTLHVIVKRLVLHGRETSTLSFRLPPHRLTILP